ncbi:helix-turn-helix transcriptional regulator [Methylorubrum rhodesianum]|jgi:DNA-binding CsgD family transcriptional regulator|uniref:Helix-turn-helix transcriptional regulator n=1 Tax=Methylorubrum rhodesianum TaxID=29427 RepID=A0ABU9ZBV1_9HYPH|nr:MULTISPECIES: helix-turn-helix transcriptional regulator [Methylorubrum]MBB5765253.1 DNA-binding CsgD family transcriptional regulator [Methylorubrum rhodesianum]MBI1691272.1 helix-turn-helix transcriptional regulator [Methylorubrum sp. DB1722]MBK3406431.1 helix-turn-helix transcriptional regulator [Methylorubrum rhodesianum]MBY0141265.1 helix-turn-helix transcriptional regulator [Methylorubrum populi]
MTIHPRSIPPILRSASIEPAALSPQGEALIDRIYEAAALPELWREVLVGLARFAGAQEAVLIVSTGTQYRDVVTTSPEFDALVSDHLRFPGNVRTERLLELRHPGFLIDLDVVTEEEIATLPLYQDFLIPRGYGAGTATTVMVPSGDSVIVHCERARAEGDFDPQTLATLNGLRPHLARAALLSARLEMERVATTTRTLEALGLPAAVLGSGGRVIGANPSLVAMMPHTLSDQPSRLAVVDPAADRLLREALTRSGQGSERAVRSIPIAASGERPPVILHLVPIRGAAHDVFTGARFVLIATPVTAQDVPSADVVQGLFDLTPGEARLATLIAAGDAPAPAAAKLGITPSTARSVLKRVFQKTGVSRQAELVGLLAGRALRE